MKLGPVTTFIVGLTMSSYASGQPVKPVAEDLVDLARVKFIESPNLPDSVAFYELLQILEILNSEDRELAIALIKSEMGLIGSEAEEFLGRMLKIFATLKLEIDRAQRDLGCSGNAPSVYGEGVYKTLEAIDDKKDAVVLERLDRLYANMENDRAARLHQWLAVQKLNIVHIKFDYKKAYERRGLSADATLAAFCIATETSAQGTAQ